MPASTTILGTVQSPVGFAVPPGACDCHVHVFGPADRFPYASTRVYTPGDASVEDLLALHDHLGLKRVVVVHPSPYGTDNAVTLDALRRLGDRARGVAVIDPVISDAKLDAMDEAGVRGVRVNLATNGIEDPEAAWNLLSATAARVEPLGWHVQCFASLPLLSRLHDRLVKLPTTLVLDHFAGARAALGPSQTGLAAVFDLLRRDRTYIKISGGYRVSTKPEWEDAGEIARALIHARPDRVVWGTDWPHPGGKRHEGDAAYQIEPFIKIDDGAALRRLRDWAGDPLRLRRILVDNPARLYGF
ncbi:MAG: amidohydrolase family protein [Alphaproteobacteria bacterium]|nr:amidohydrolase family protein [Alphaproteobacteria bacterium]